MVVSCSVVDVTVVVAAGFAVVLAAAVVVAGCSVVAASVVVVVATVVVSRGVVVSSVLVVGTVVVVWNLVSASSSSSLGLLSGSGAHLAGASQSTRTCSDAPRQLAPASAATIFLDLDLSPTPHVAEHADQSDQSDQAQPSVSFLGTVFSTQVLSSGPSCSLGGHVHT